MNKRLTILMLLMVFFVPWAAKAQETLTVHDGTTTNNYVPVYGYYADAYLKCEMLYPATELGNMESGTITGMKFYASQSSVTWGSANFQVFLTEVGSTTIDAFVGSGTNVFNGALSIVNGEMNVTFTTPYDYQGGNLLVGVYNTTTGSYVTSSWYGETVSNASYQGYSYSNLSSVSGSQRNFLPKTTFTYEPNNSCPKPTDVAVSDITPNGATVSWTGDSDSYLVVVSEAAQDAVLSYDFEDGWQGWTTFQGNTTSPNSWMHNTAYPSSNNDFSTGYGNNSSDGFMLSESYISGTSSGAGTAVTPDNYLVSPQVRLGGSISFYAGARNTSYCAEKFSVMVSTTDNTNAASFTTVGTWTLSLSQAGYNSTPYSVDLSAYSGMGYIAIRHYDCYDQWFLAVDDITISTNPASSSMTYPATSSPFTINDPEFITPGSTYNVQVIGICGDEESNPSTIVSFTVETCPAPTNVTITDETPHGATISWNGTSDSYIVNVQQAGFIYDFESAEPWTITDFSPCSVYDGDQATVYGMNDCDYENENSTDNPVAMSCIAFQNGKTDYLYAHSGNAFGVMICPTASTGVAANDWFILPAITIGDNYIFSFWGREIKTDWGAETINVGIYDENNPGSFSAYLTNGQNISIDGLVWTQYSFDLSAYRNQTIRLAINYVSNDIFGFMLDDIYVGNSAWDYTYTGVTSPFVLNDPEQINSEATYNVQVIGICSDEESNSSPIVSFTTLGSCPKPTNFSYSDVTGHTATLSWDENGTATDWVLEYGTASDFTDATSVNVSDTASIQLTGLNGETTYYARVKANCGDGDESNWVTTSFTTDVTCPVPTELTVVENSVTGHEATVTWNGSCEGYIVYLGINTTPAPENVDFSNGIPNTWNNDATYPWTVTDGYIKSGNAGVASSTSTISVTVTFPADGTIEFDAQCRGEGTSYDVCKFLIDNNVKFTKGANGEQWDHYSYDVTAGQHAFTWSYTKDSSVNPDGDYFAIDNVTMMIPPTIVWDNPITVENTEYTFNGLASETTYIVKVQSDCGEEGLSAESNSVTFTTEISCPAPSGLNVSDISGHSATASWNKMATEVTGPVTFNYVCVATGDTLNWDNASIVVDSVDDPNPPTVNLSGLVPETEYTFYLRRDCGDDDYSKAVSVTFTTDITCPAPTDLAVVENSITGHGATLNWTGYSDSYIVKYRTPAYIDGISEEFGTSIPSGWEMYTGLLSNGTATMTSATYGWTFGTGNGVFDNHARVNIYSNYQRWLVMPAITVPAGSGFSFDLALTAYSGSDVPAPATTGTDDKFIVLISTDNMATWTTLREWNNSGSTYVYNNIANTANGENVNIDLSAFAGRSVRIAFYGESTVSNADNNLHIDNVTLGAFIPAGEWQTVITDSTSIALTGLTPETLYEVVVQGDCGEEGMSAESTPITFSTLVSCPAPTPLEATDVTSNSAVLHWTGDAENYNVSYYKTFFFDSFEEDLSQWTIYKEGDDNSWEWGIENPHDNSADLNAHSGNYAAVAYSDVDVHADSWLVSPQILFPNQTTLKFWIMRSTYDDAPDEYEVRLSTTGNAIEDFDVVLKEKAAANSTWTEVTIDLSQYDGQQGYIAIRHDYIGGFFIMVDDFGIYGWSEEIATTDNSLLIEDLLPETEYLWHVQADCGDEDGLSQWSSMGTFTTLRACPVPFDLTITEETAYGATISWTGYNDSYEVMVGQLETATINYDFEGQSISADFTNSTSYPWTAVQESQDGSYCMKSGNGGVSSSTSSISLTMTSLNDGTIEFDAVCMGEGTSTYWDHCDFTIDGTRLLYAGANISGWNHYSYEVAAGEHTFTWSYTKDSSVDPTGDYFAVDNILLQSSNVSSWITYTASESPFIFNDATNILPEATYLVKVKGICGDEETEYSEGITFTTLDESTKIFVIEGDWSDGDNWVPAGVPSMEQDVILRAEATVFDVAEANIITIEGAAALIIEDGGQLKTNADVEATMKKFIIGYGTDYVETNNGYYLMTLPTADPISASDAGLITEESDYDLYGWDRTATDEEWQNNHEGIDLQNGIGFLYANRDDMEMSFTATLRNSSEPVVVTPAYDEVEHGGWNLCGNPFPCEAYITTEAEDMTFYRLVDNALVPIEGAIAPLEAFFVKATAAGQTFTISREATRE